jgi:hypothetical protein
MLSCLSAVSIAASCISLSDLIFSFDRISSVEIVVVGMRQK